MEPKPCPFCGSKNLELKHNTTPKNDWRGHFDDLRVVCLDCSATQGIGNRGKPGYNEMLDAWTAWNQRTPIKRSLQKRRKSVTTKL